GGRTGPPGSLSPPNRRSQSATSEANSGSDAIIRCACARSAKPRVPSAYSAASTSLSGFSIMTRGTPESAAGSAAAKFLPCSPASRISPQAARGSSRCSRRATRGVGVLLPGRPGRQAGEEAAKLISHFVPGERSRFLRRRFHRLRLLLEGRFALLPDHVEGPVARDCNHPGDRGRPPGIELAGVAPDTQIRVLHHLFGEIAPP